MSAINNAFKVIGNVTKDIELKRTSEGVAMATYTVAVDNVYCDKHGEKHKRTDFIPITVYGKQAENNAKYLKMGARVIVTGQIRSWYIREKIRVDSISWQSRYCM